MMFKNSSKSFLVFIGFVISSVYSGLIPKPQPKNIEVDDVNENGPYYCWVYTNCYADTIEHKKYEECANHLDNEDIQLLLENIPEGSNVTAYPNIYDAISKLYCIRDEEFKRRVFYDICKQGLSITTVGCEQRYSEKICDNLYEAMDCTISLFAKFTDEGKCVKYSAY
ncbi:uncharacterized protein LOC129981838 [Argiope bruennichi]|uniref:uncharacterized protein LOC129981838 n=1 Tax=Argiope bruennichi TaxID=94029 RepID=UPI0024958130|nr:uncharacterized protein LOC129981838 [Argiope bruennichi]